MQCFLYRGVFLCFFFVFLVRGRFFLFYGSPWFDSNEGRKRKKLRCYSSVVEPGTFIAWRNKLCGRPPQYAPASCKLTFDLESGVRITCEVGYTSVPILVLLGLSVLDLGPMYATDRRQTHIIA